MRSFAVLLLCVSLVAEAGMPSVEVVDSGTAKARDLAGESVLLPDPFRLPDIPVVDSSSEAAWKSHGEAFEDPAESKRLADFRQRVEANYAADSTFPPNPSTGIGLNRFDLRLMQTVDTPQGLFTFTYFANSADGSLLFPEWTLDTLLPAGREFTRGQMHFVLRRADGDILACGKHETAGLGCLQLGENLGPAFAWLQKSTQQKRFLESIPRTPQTLQDPPAGSVQGVRGKTGDGFIQMWLDRRASSIRTQQLFLGAGVGIIKDPRTRSNRLVRRTLWEDADRIVADLVEMESARIERDTSAYRLVTAFTSQGISEATTLGLDLNQLQAEAAEIQQALDACPKGSTGKDCRKTHRQRMKELNERARQQALDYARRHGLPVGD